MCCPRAKWKILSLTLGLLSVAACGSPIPATSNLDVTNGMTTSAYPSVVALYLRLPEGDGTCTGTFITDSQVVSAAHCVYDIVHSGGDAKDLAFEQHLPNGMVRLVPAVHLAYNPNYVDDPKQLSNHDTSVITFPRGSAPATTPLYPAEPQIGQVFTIVGFGQNDYGSGNEQGGGGIKRFGTNEVQAIRDHMIQFFGVPTATYPGLHQGNDVASGSGDSGGPLLINGALAATTVGGGVLQVKNARGQTVAVKASNYVELSEEANRAFLRQQLTSTPGW